MSLALWACDPRGNDVERGVAVPHARIESPEARARGRAIFVDKCALCHGVDADGRGVRTRGLSAPPVNFRSARWRERASAADVYVVLQEGKRGTSMPAWPGLSDSQKWDVVSYVIGVSEESR